MNLEFINTTQKISEGNQEHEVLRRAGQCTVVMEALGKKEAGMARRVSFRLRQVKERMNVWIW